MERCFCCNARLSGAVTCPRCQADFGLVIDVEQAAQFWLSSAIQYSADNEAGKSLDALDHSLQLKKTRLAQVFRDFLIQQLCQDVLELLAQKKVLPAKRRLYRMRSLLPCSVRLQQLQMFTEYLLVNKQ